MYSLVSDLQKGDRAYLQPTCMLSCGAGETKRVSGVRKGVVITPSPPQKSPDVKILRVGVIGGTGWRASFISHNPTRVA